MKELLTALCGDVDYQSRLREDFRRRRVHPTIEALVWAHAVGKPTEQVRLSADVTTNQKFDEERELFGRLSVEQLEVLQADSQALIDKARALAAEANALPHTPATTHRAPAVDEARGPGGHRQRRRPLR